jgi:hypothetical protein
LSENVILLSGSDCREQVDGYRSYPVTSSMQALSPEEYELLRGHPVFSDWDRALFFQLNAREQQYFNQLQTPGTRPNFLLQLGYFRARQRFFIPTSALVASG